MREKNLEKEREYRRKSYHKHKEKINAERKEWRKNNPDEVRNRYLKYYPKHSEKAKERAKNWANENKKWIKERSNRHRKENPASYMLYRTRRACKEIGIECDMTEAWFKERLDSGVCEMSGLKFDMQGKRTALSPSIDRIIPDGPYSMKNCRIIIWSLNRAMSNYGEDHLIDIFKAIFKKRGITC